MNNRYILMLCALTTLTLSCNKNIQKSEDENKEQVSEVIADAPDQTNIAGRIAAAEARQLSSKTRHYSPADFNTESYNAITENRFHEARQNPLSTFGIDVDAASYSNIRRFINGGQLPPVDAVRIEEMINYFDYEYPQPQNNAPVAIMTEVSTAPWNQKHQLVKIGLQAKTITYDKLPASNFVFLIDVSGSMNSANKLPLVKSSIRLLVDQLRDKDRVSIVVYAGAAGEILKPTSGESKQTIKDALNRLEAGGSTAGGAGIALAYKLARENFIKDGNNRVILATDGDFNVGASSDAEMQRLIENEKKSGVYLTVLGYGMGNYKDSKMETLADKGNGNFAYIDNISEARKTLITEFGGTLFTVAKDVKLQVEFNPAKVSAYRLIGYENRMLNKEDFNNDQKDAGDMGSGHTVTALYEIIPIGVKSSFIESVDDLKYQKMPEPKPTGQAAELLTIKLRYKAPDKDQSLLISKSIPTKSIAWENTSPDFRFSAAVAGYGMLLRNSEFKQNTNYKSVLNWAESGLGKDKEGYRAEFLTLVRSSGLMAKDLLSIKDKLIMDSSR
ncbi:vWA domain-containing protein [Daejeonella lutea]|uniref:Ca-activated chloride channel family protein n=1 Tax=Daejeonella lutea TaxID=572036 RepID=A0A1T5DUP0_9SPHI|nr:VWA domain-containing protein [Daejeonella lutea]SKB75276.1 Ca-activated chloride channel family protein [Daejeonella lutea]